MAIVTVRLIRPLLRTNVEIAPIAQEVNTVKPVLMAILGIPEMEESVKNANATTKQRLVTRIPGTVIVLQKE